MGSTITSMNKHIQLQQNDTDGAVSGYTDEVDQYLTEALRNFKNTSPVAVQVQKKRVKRTRYYSGRVRKVQ